MLKYNTDKQALYNFVRERQEELLLTGSDQI